MRELNLVRAQWGCENSEIRLKLLWKINPGRLEVVFVGYSGAECWPRWFSCLWWACWVSVYPWQGGNNWQLFLLLFWINSQQFFTGAIVSLSSEEWLLISVGVTWRAASLVLTRHVCLNFLSKQLVGIPAKSFETNLSPRPKGGGYPLWVPCTDTAVACSPWEGIAGSDPSQKSRSRDSPLGVHTTNILENSTNAATTPKYSAACWLRSRCHYGEVLHKTRGTLLKSDSGYIWFLDLESRIAPLKIMGFSTV